MKIDTHTHTHTHTPKKNTPLPALPESPKFKIWTQWHSTYCKNTGQCQNTASHGRSTQIDSLSEATRFVRRRFDQPLQVSRTELRKVAWPSPISEPTEMSLSICCPFGTDAMAESVQLSNLNSYSMQVQWVGWNPAMRIYGINKGVSKNRGTPKWMVYNGKPY